MKWLMLLFLMNSAFSCELNLAPLLVFMSKTMTPNDWQPLMKSSNCSPEITQNIFDRLKDSEGKIISAQFTADYAMPIVIKPDVFEVTTLESLLRKKINKLFQKITINGQLTSRLILLDNYDNILIQCQNCENNPNTYSFGKMGERDNQLLWQVQITTSQNKTNLLVATESANIKKVYRATTHLQALGRINPENLETTYIAEDKNQEFFADDQLSISNFDLIKDLNPGDILTYKNLRPKKIVSIGKAVEAQIKSNGIELTIPAMALESGTMGQIIQIKNLKNKKQLSAEIIGINKVLINL